MQQWNQHFSEDNREDNIHRDDHVTNRQSDFRQQTRQNQFNMPHGNEGYGQPYTDMNQQDDVYSNYRSERFRSQQPYNWEDDMKMEQRGRNIDRDWQNLTNWADDVTRRNNMGNTSHNPYMRTQNPNNYGETYNPENRSFNPMFADDEGGFTGGNFGNNEDLNSGYNRDFGFDRGNSFSNNNSHSWPQNTNRQHNQHEGQNRWEGNNGNRSNSQNRGGFFGH